MIKNVSRAEASVWRHRLASGFIGSAWLLVLSLSGSIVAISEDSNASHAFYSRAVIQEVQLEIPNAERERLYAALPQRVYVRGTFRWNDTLVENVGIRFKGNSSSHPDQPFKRSYLIKFNEFEKGQRFLGMRRVALDNAIQFGGLFSEILITDILRALGNWAPRANYSRLSVNGEYQGVYVNVERIDKSFVSRRYGKPRGALFKGEGGPGVNLASAGSDPHIYRKTFEPKTEAAESAYDELSRLLELVSAEMKPSDPETLRRLFFWDEFVRTIAVMLLSGAFDQLTGWNPHNFYLYQTVGEKRWHYIPSDLDVGFADQAFGRIPVIDGWNAAWPIAGGPPRPVLEKLLYHPTLLSEYRSEADRILEEYFRPELLHSKIDRLYSLIAEDLKSDPFPTRRATVPSDRNYDDVVRSMKAFIVKRYETARRQLDQPGERPPTPTQAKPTREQNSKQVPRPGIRPGAPTDLRVTSRSGNLIRLEWNDNAVGEVAHVVQRTDGQDQELFWNHIGRSMPNAIEAVDDRFDDQKTYAYRVYAVFPSPEGPVGTAVSNVAISRP